MTYRIEGRERLWAWAEGQTDLARAHRVIRWVADLTQGDFEAHQRLPGRRIPVYVGVTAEPEVMIEFSVVEQHQVITVLKIIDLAS